MIYKYLYKDAFSNIEILFTFSSYYNKFMTTYVSSILLYTFFNIRFKLI